jgi:hypothetical protein
MRTHLTFIRTRKFLYEIWPAQHDSKVRPKSWKISLLMESQSISMPYVVLIGLCNKISEVKALLKVML